MMHVQKGLGKDIKRVRAKLLGLGSTYGSKKPEVRLLELPEKIIRRDIEISLTRRFRNLWMIWSQMR